MRMIFAYLSIFTAIWNFVYGAPCKVPVELYKHTVNSEQNPGLFPYIGHINFRIIADHVINENTEWFDPELVEQGDILYVNVWYLPWFEEQVHDQIKYPYILVSCDAGNLIPGLRSLNKLLYDPKCA